MRAIVAIAAHKPCAVPEDRLYLPLRVGAFRDDTPWPLPDGTPWARDDAGENISGKNDSYCELTALWWLWKHADADALGLCHYRRYFSPGGKRALTHAQAEKLLADCDMLLPKKRHYWIETNYSQYVHAHHEQDLLLTRRVLAALPDTRYALAFDQVMRRRSGHRFNMLLARRPAFDAWCTWLFDVLQAVEAQLDISAYSANDRRVFGFLAERLLDVWLTVNPQRVREVHVWHTEPQHWPRKIATFLKRKFCGR